jgi:formylglycine-generating enzyme required for sulfatase activity
MKSMAWCLTAVACVAGAILSGCSQKSETIMLPGDVPLEMVWIPEGSFVMGSPDTEQDGSTAEGPQHAVIVGGFWMAKFELTKRQWTAVMGTTPWVGHANVLDDPQSPAVYVSWNNAQALIAALNGLTGKTFQLPSEAQWEYACRAGTDTRFYWGDDPGYTEINDYAWWKGNVVSAGEPYAHEVGQKRPNAFGLYDMSGNVWELCEDDRHSDYTGAPTDGSAWINSPRDASRVSRGANWASNGEYCRSAYRGFGEPITATAGIGFRLAGF